MEFQTLEKNNKKKWIIGSIVVIALIVTITYIGTRAKYKTTGNIPIAKGTINYKYDLELLAVKLQNDVGSYDNIDTIPTSGYILNEEKSICKVEGEKQDTTMTYENGKINILGLSKKGTKCVIYFDKFYSKDLILANNTIDTRRATGPFTEPFNEDTKGKIFSANDDDGDTYFFAGQNPNNWVKFGTNKEGQDLYWRIIRINGDNSIRLIYNGPTTDQEGETTQIGTSLFNENHDDNKYVGYMYDSNTISSTIKNYLDTWYEENLKVNYSSYIDTNAGFCGDRSIFNGAGSSASETEYAPRIRMYNTYIPTYKCLNKANDLYTLKESKKGNKVLKNPIGLITIDELIYAGGYKGVSDLSYNHWLKTGVGYHTISPNNFNGTTAGVLRVSNSGFLGGSFTNSSNGVRPVINLKSNILIVGKGTTMDPYRIV